MKNEIHNFLSPVNTKVKKPFIGLVVEEGCVKLAYVAAVKGKKKLMQTTSSIIQSKSAVDKNLSIQKALHQAFKEIKVKDVEVVCVVNCPKTSVSKVVMPSMPDHELIEAIRWEAKNQFPFSLDAALLTHKVLTKIKDKGVVKQDILVAATMHESVMEVLQFFKAWATKDKNPVNYKVASVIPASVALEGLFVNLNMNSKEIVAVVYMQESLSEFNIYQNSSLQFSRKLPVTSADIIKSMMRELVSDKGQVQLTEEEAKNIKVEYGIPNKEQTELIKDKISGNQILSLIRPKLEQLSKEMERSMDFYREESGQRIGKIILLGVGSRMKGLAQFLSDELDIEVLDEEFFKNVNGASHVVVDKEQLVHEMDLAIGAALYGTSGVNFLAKKPKVVRRFFWWQKMVIGICGFLTLLLLLLFIDLSSKIVVTKGELAIAKKEYKRLLPKLKIAKDKMVLYKNLMEKPHLEEFLSGVGRNIPKGMYLVDMNMKKEEVTLKGISIESEESSEAMLSNFIKSLESEVCENVNLIETHKNEKDVGKSEFTILCEM
jgi:type IV pilus assembly protein PilM